jgi:hypothetical protein
MTGDPACRFGRQYARARELQAQWGSAQANQDVPAQDEERDRASSIGRKPVWSGIRARAAGGSLIVLCAHNGDELLATLRRATHEIITPVVRYIGDLITTKVSSAVRARARMRYEILPSQ